MTVCGRVQLVHGVHLHFQVRNGCNGPVLKVRHNDADHRLQFTLATRPDHMTNNQHIITAPHDLYQDLAQPLFHVNVRLSIGVTVLQLVPLSLLILLRVPRLDFLIATIQTDNNTNVILA